MQILISTISYHSTNIFAMEDGKWVGILVIHEIKKINLKGVEAYLGPEDINKSKNKSFILMVTLSHIHTVLIRNNNCMHYIDISNTKGFFLYFDRS